RSAWRLPDGGAPEGRLAAGRRHPGAGHPRRAGRPGKPVWTGRWRLAAPPRARRAGHPDYQLAGQGLWRPAGDARRQRRGSTPLRAAERYPGPLQPALARCCPCRGPRPAAQSGAGRGAARAARGPRAPVPPPAAGGRPARRRWAFPGADAQTALSRGQAGTRPPHGARCVYHHAPQLPQALPGDKPGHPCRAPAGRYRESRSRTGSRLASAAAPAGRQRYVRCAFSRSDARKEIMKSRSGLQETYEAAGWSGRFGEYDEFAAPYAGAQGETWDGEFGRRRFGGGQTRPRRPAVRRPVARTQSRRPAARFAPTRRRRPGQRPHQRRRRRRFIMAGRRMMGPPSPQQGTEYMRWVQNALNQILGRQLPENGIAGPETRDAVREFQGSRGLPVTGLVGPKTEEALTAALAEKQPATTGNGNGAPEPAPG